MTCDSNVTISVCINCTLLTIYAIAAFGTFLLFLPCEYFDTEKENNGEKVFFLSIMTVVELSCEMSDSLFTFFSVTRDFPFQPRSASPLSRLCSPIQQTFFRTAT